MPLNKEAKLFLWYFFLLLQLVVILVSCVNFFDKFSQLLIFD